MDNNKHYQVMVEKGCNFNPLTPKDFKDIRQLYDLSQRSFAEMLDIKVKTLQSYELGSRKPHQATIALMNFAKNDVPYFKKFIKHDPRPYCFLLNPVFK